MKLKRKLLAVITAAATVFSLCACSSESGYSNSDSGKLKIISTVFPPYDLARQIAGDNAEISILLPPGSEIHNYEPSAKDMIAIRNCDIFLYIGGENEQWAEKLINSNDTENVTAVKLIDYVPTLSEDEDEHDHEHDHEHEHEHETDEHIWTSPQNAQLMLSAVYDAICKVDPSDKQTYTKNKDAYAKQLSDLDNAYRSAVDNAKNKTIVLADKFPFRYLAHEYGLEFSAAFAACSDESEPGVSTMIKLTKTIKENNIPAVYYLEFSSTKIADTLCDETGATKLMLHSCHNVSKQDIENNVSYVDLMKQNLENLKSTLNG
ncbi:aBC-type metal ion transport system periplasmic component/surface adhesin [[Eubacterium] siraeum CAG:80]|uniref:ABC-type metal ion transport system periplasmic component/surface adhesin n=1 Tax=[Eubacterium] siraeum CAG:80 TaxID=1263080 RepID=R6SMB3_9FIRM|nr:aBC-type metal ion transport system periplasmic component/surface adhesin [[Eubacterium] siraeum CAG:80]